MDRANVDTDQIIPKQFLKRIERTGYGPFLFFDWRYFDDGKTPNPEFELNQPQASGRVDPAGPPQLRLRLQPRACRLGDRELRLPRRHRADASPTSSTTTASRTACCRSSSAKSRSRTCFSARPSGGYKLTVDLNTCRVTDGQGLSLPFEVDESRRHCLLNGLDDIALTLQHADKIAAFERSRGMQPGRVTPLRY